MKNLILLFTFMLFSMSSHAQENQGKQIQYCTMYFLPATNTEIHNAKVDFGEKELYLIVQDGKKVKGTYVAFLNLMTKNGWKFVESINDKHYMFPVFLFMKEIESSDDLKKGLELKED